MPDRHTLEEASREEAAERALDAQPVVIERGPGEAIVEPLAPPAHGLTDAFNEPTVTRPARRRSPSQLIWMKLRRNRAAMFGLYTLAALYLAAVLAGFLAPYKYDNADHDLPFHPPMLTRIHFLDDQGKLSRPFVYGIAPVAGQHAVYNEDHSKKYPLRLFVK